MSEIQTEQTHSMVLRRTLIPPTLEQLGVRIGRDEASGFQVVVIPPSVREVVNVLDPVQSFAQADPNWTPSIRVVQLDPSKDGPHFYSNPAWSGKVAPSKQALELLAKAGGVVYTRTQRIPRDELDDGEIGYKATLGIRRSDGTIEEITRDKVWNEEVEREDIEAAVARAGKGADEFKKRWLQERRDRYAKTESKAVLRAIRAALQIPHQFTPQDAAKPFAVVGYSFTPDYDDVETKRILIAAGLNAQAAIYGPGASETRSSDLELPAGEPPAETTPAAESPDVTESSAPGGIQQAGAAGQTPHEETDGPVAPAPGTSDADDIDFAGEPSLEDEPPPREGFQAPAGAVDAEAEERATRAAAAGEVPIPNGQYAKDGLTIRQVAEKGGRGEAWLLWALKDWSRDAFRQAVEDYVRVFVPEVWAKYEAALAEGEQAA